MGAGLTSHAKLIVILLLAVSGCSKQADENKPISEVKAEATALEIDDLREMAVAYKQAIVEKLEDVEKIKAKIKKIPIGEIIGEESTALKNDVEQVLKSVAALKERFTVYYDELKKKNGDVTDLSID